MIEVIQPPPHYLIQLSTAHCQLRMSMLFVWKKCISLARFSILHIILFFSYFARRIRDRSIRVLLQSLWPSLSFSCHHHIYLVFVSSCYSFFLLILNNGWSLVCRVDVDDFFPPTFFSLSLLLCLCFRHAWDLFQAFYFLFIFVMYMKISRNNCK